MDVSAILNADDELLKEMGLIKAGDRLSIRGFCSSISQSDKEEDGKSNKRRLLEAFLRKKKGKKALPSKKCRQGNHPTHTGNTEKERKRMVQLGWKHFKEEEDVYALVPLAKGGGSRQVELPLSTTKWELLKTCKTLFFPNGNSIFGKEEEMAFDLADFKNEKIEVTLNVAGKELPFSIKNYIEAHKVKNVRLYLRSRKLYDFSSEGDDTKDYLPVIDFGHVERETGLIGSTEERQALLLEQDLAFQESLAKDQQKRIQLENEATEIGRKVRIQHARAARVLPEPDADFVTVKVRHLTKDVRSRRFPSSAKMSAVYDWAGSFSPDTENFALCDPLGDVLLPSAEISDRCTVTMIKALQTPSMSDSDNEIQFQGFGEINNGSTTTLPDPQTSQQPDGERNEVEASQ